ncbi:putative Regulator of Vps4 activity in the MVB pathway [Trypanosoma vivax]|uniref:IST1-like protein n=1 Tax=Trypanosoma vivax (strain Y486) TaxID=1055687 RepID=G0U5R0_TRYVY|nr:hypothetical protein TRVL_02843 [Trypanosoma vivax]KAH8608247.1 putative Regulator of Vps4 activity in the MVB pathway [Trypanosoma vivax]CCC51211.1 conserved hypothetical protein [Trypanosoma vivax Y486]
MKWFSSGKKPQGFDPIKVKANVRMAITRVRMQQNKLVNSVKIQRRQLAELLVLHKYESARVKVEQALRDDVSIEGLEVLVFFLDLLSNRLQLLAGISGVGKDEPALCPPELKECVTSILWAAARLGSTVPELENVRNYLEVKFGKLFVTLSSANAEFSVNQKMLDRLDMAIPSNERCIEYLSLVAIEHAVEGYDEDKIRSSSGLVSSTPDLRDEKERNTESDGGAPAVTDARHDVIRTPSGLVIPALTSPRDELERRLLHLKRA